MPLAAIASSTGVRATRPPLQPNVSYRCWSVVTNRILRPMSSPRSRAAVALTLLQDRLQRLEPGTGRSADGERQHRRLRVDRVERQRRAVIEIDHVDGAQMVAEHRRSDAVLETPQQRITRDDLFGHRHAGTRRDDAHDTIDL